MDHAQVAVTGTFRVTGSVLQETIVGECVGIQTKVSLRSDAPESDVARLLKVAENGCFTIAALRNPTPVTTEVELNGSPLT